jgi:hypothetical protein
VELHTLQQNVHVQRCVVIIEPHNQAKRHLLGAERVHEASAEGVGWKRPTQGVNHSVKGALYLPHLFDAQREDLGVRGSDPLPLAPRLGEHATGPFREHRNSAGDIGRLLVTGPRRTGSVQASRCRANAPHGVSCHQKRFYGKSREDVHAQFLGALAQPAHDLAERCGVEAGVVHRGRGGNPLGPILGEEIDRFTGDRLSERKPIGGEIGEEIVEDPRIHYRAR